MPDSTSIQLKHLDHRLVENVRRIVDALSRIPQNPAYGQPPRALLVGGCVRDALLGISSTDVDLEVYGVSAEQLESLLQHLYPGIVNSVGKSFGILKIHLAEDIGLDIALPRSESKAGTGHKGFSINSDPGMDPKTAAQRRDFTINSIAADPLTGELMDPFNGAQDLKSKILRITDPERFQDDPLRVYRAIQLVARFNLTVESETLTLLTQMVDRGDLEELAPERITEELKKLLLKSEKPSIGFELMRELGIIKKYFPELHVLADTPQEKEWHPEGDVWIHTMMVVDQAAHLSRQPERNFIPHERLQVIFGSLCHDLGKPSTTHEDGGRIRSHGHEEAGKEPTQQLCKRLGMSERVTAAAVAIAMNHLKPGMLFGARKKGELTYDSYRNAVRKLLKRIAPVSWQVLICASEADFRGRTLPGVADGPYPAGDLFTKTIIENGLDENPTHTLLQGRDLLELGLEPGPRVGAIIQQVEELRDAGKITTREEALAHARTLPLH